MRTLYRRRGFLCRSKGAGTDQSYSCARSTVLLYCKENHLPVPSQRKGLSLSIGNRITKQERERMYRLRLSGMSLSETSRETGRSETSVRNAVLAYCKMHDLPIPGSKS